MHFSKRVEVSEPNVIAVAECDAISRGTGLIRLSDSNPTRHSLGITAKLSTSKDTSKTTDGYDGAPKNLPKWPVPIGLSPKATALPVYEASPRGPRDARESLAEFLSERDGRNVNPDQLYLLSSTSEAYAWLMKLLCDPGDRILAPTPGYPLVEEIARLESVAVDYYPLTWLGSRWELGFLPMGTGQNGKSLPFCPVPIGKNAARGIVAINPNNPTGSYIHGEERERLVNLATSADIPIIADEVFFHYRLSQSPDSGDSRNTSPDRPVSFAGEERALTFVLDGLSKNLSAPGAKVAWIEVSGPPELRAEAQQRLDAIADAYLPFSDYLATALPGWLAAIPEQLQRTRNRCRENLNCLRELIDQEPTGAISLFNPEGGWNALIRFPSYIEEDELVTYLIRTHGITAQPGYFFDMPLRGVVSVSLLLEPDIFRRASKVLLETIATKSGLDPTSLEIY